MSENINAENATIIDTINAIYRTSARLSFDMGNREGMRGLHIHHGLGYDHYVDESIRDVNVLVAIVKAMDFGYKVGNDRGADYARSQVREALGITQSDDGSLSVTTSSRY